jgi:hypothetical protein
MSKANEMLIAVNSGFVDDDGEAREITAGRDRIAPEILRERPQYREFFDPAVSAPGTNAAQARYRVTLPGGRGVIAA